MIDAIPAFVIAPEARAESYQSLVPNRRASFHWIDDRATVGGLADQHFRTRETAQYARADTFTSPHQLIQIAPEFSILDNPGALIVIWALSIPTLSHTKISLVPRILSNHNDPFRRNDEDTTIAHNSRHKGGGLTTTPALDGLFFTSNNNINPFSLVRQPNFLQVGAYMHLGPQQVCPHSPPLGKPLKNRFFSMLAPWPAGRHHASTSGVHDFRRLFIDIMQSRQRLMVFKLLFTNRLPGRTYSGCVMQNQEKSKSIARIAGLRMIGGRAGMEDDGAGLAMRRRPARGRLQKRSEKDRSPKRTGRREQEPGLPESVLKAPGGPIAALLRTAPGATGGRSFTENFAAFSEEHVPCLAMARSQRPDGIRAKLPEPPEAGPATPVKPVLH